MKFLKTTFFKSTNVIISFLLFVLGFSTSCDLIGIRAEYGSPHADFIINGSVKASETNQAIPNIKVKASWDSVYTDQSGNYEINIQSFPEDQDIQLLFIDTDGEANGDFQQLDTIIQFKNINFDKEGTWYYGEVEKEFNVTLNKKQ